MTCFSSIGSYDFARRALSLEQQWDVYWIKYGLIGEEIHGRLQQMRACQ